MNISTFAPLLGNLWLLFIFIQAFSYPASHQDFIENTSYIFFVTELISLAACLLLIKYKTRPQDLGLTIKNDTTYDRVVNKLEYFSIACFFIIGAIIVGYATTKWFIPLLFSISLLSKAYSDNFITNEKSVKIYTIIFGLSYFFIVFSAVVWGILYFGILVLFELYRNYNYIKTIRLKPKSV